MMPLPSPGFVSTPPDPSVAPHPTYSVSDQEESRASPVPSLKYHTRGPYPAFRPIPLNMVPPRPLSHIPCGPWTCSPPSSLPYCGHNLTIQQPRALARTPLYLK